MAEPTPYSFIRYLTAKKTVDDRALNRHVWDLVASSMREAQRTRLDSISVLEVGAGIGTMIERCAEKELFTRCIYCAIDADRDNVVAAEARLPQRLRNLGFESADSPDGTPSVETYPRFSLQCQRPGSGVDGSDTLEIRFEQADLFDFAVRPEQRKRYDLLIAHAFLDLVEARHALALLAGMMQDDAQLYLTINFDGATILQPTIDTELDAEIERLYHETMDHRTVDGRPSGDSHTGRHLFGHLRDAGMDILAAGSSDWVVCAGQEGYPGDEAYFLHFIVDTIYRALVEQPLLAGERFGAWIRRRHEQIENGELVYIAHQLDLLARLQE